MVDLFMERHFARPLTPGDVIAMGAEGAGCFGLYKIDWLESFLGSGGNQLFCHFRAPDTESLRMAMRQVDGPVAVIWPGSAHGDGGTCSANVLVERRFDAPVHLEDIHAIEVAGKGCLEARNVVYERTFFSTDRRRMVCLYRAPDAESVRQAQSQAGMPVERVWLFQRLDPAQLAK